MSTVQKHSVQKPSGSSEPAPESRSSSSSPEQITPKPKKKISRLRTGCWTCRRRGYKCDEGKPHCKSCIRLNLDCEGYGIRLKWQDDGYFNQSQIASGKSVIGMFIYIYIYIYFFISSLLIMIVAFNHTNTFTGRKNQKRNSSSSICISDSVSTSDKKLHPHLFENIVLNNKKLKGLSQFTSFPASSSPSFQSFTTSLAASSSSYSSDNSLSFLAFDGEKNTFNPTSPALKIPSNPSTSNIVLNTNNTKDNANSVNNDNTDNDHNLQPSSTIQPSSSIIQPSSTLQPSSSSLPFIQPTASNSIETPNKQVVPIEKPPSNQSPVPTFYQSVVYPNQSFIPQDQISPSIFTLDTSDEVFTSQFSYPAKAEVMDSAPLFNKPASAEHTIVLRHDQLNKIAVSKKLITKIVLDLGEECTLPLVNHSIPGRKLISDEASEATRTGNTFHPFNKYPVSHLSSHMFKLSGNISLPVLSIDAPFESLASNPSVVESLLAHFQSEHQFWFSFTIPNDKFIAQIIENSKNCPPLVNAICAISSFNISILYSLHPSNNINNDPIFNKFQYDIYLGLESVFRSLAFNGLQQLILNGHNESSIACALMLADLERAKGNLQSWGEMLDLCVDGYFYFVKLYGEETIFSSVVANPSAEPGLFEFFWGIADVIGSHDILWTLSTDATPRMVEFFGHYWRYIPSVPAIGIENMSPYAAFSRYILGFFSEIYSLSASVKNKQSIANQQAFVHLSGITRHFYACDKTNFNSDDIDKYLDLRSRLDMFSSSFLDGFLPKVEYFHTLAQYILTMTKIIFMLRLDSSEDIAATLALSNYHNINYNSKKIKVYKDGYKLPEIKKVLFDCLEKLDPRTNSCMSVSAAEISKNPASGYLYQALECMSMLLPVCIFMNNAICSLQAEKDLVQAFSEEVYARIPTSALGHIIQFGRLFWKLRPVVDEQPFDQDPNNNNSVTPGLEMKLFQSDSTHIQPPDTSLPWEYLINFPFELFVPTSALRLDADLTNNATPLTMYLNSETLSTHPESSSVAATASQLSTFAPTTQATVPTAESHMTELAAPATLNADVKQQIPTNLGMTCEMNTDLLAKLSDELEKPNTSTVVVNQTNEHVVKEEYLKILASLNRRDLLAIIVSICGSFVAF